MNISATGCCLCGEIQTNILLKKPARGFNEWLTIKKYAEAKLLLNAIKTGLL